MEDIMKQNMKTGQTFFIIAMWVGLVHWNGVFYNPKCFTRFEFPTRDNSRIKADWNLMSEIEAKFTVQLHEKINQLCTATEKKRVWPPVKELYCVVEDNDSAKYIEEIKQTGEWKECR